MNEIGKRIKYIRKDNHLNQSDFGKKLRLSQDLISALELGKRKPQLDTLDLIALHFGVKLDWLLYGTGEIYKDPFEGIEGPEHLKELGRKIARLPENEYNKIIKIIDTFLEQ